MRRYGRSTRRSGRGWEANPELLGGREAHPEVCEGSGVPPEGLGVVGRYTRGSMEGSRVPPGDPEGLGCLYGGSVEDGRLTQRTIKGWEDHLEVREGLGGPPRCLGGVGRPTRYSRKRREARPKVWERLRGPPGGM